MGIEPMFGREEQSIIFSWKQWQCAIYPVGFTLGWCPEWTINKIFVSQYWKLYFTAINKVSLATTYADLIHRVSSTKGKQVHADRNGYMTGQSMPPQMGTRKQSDAKKLQTKREFSCPWEYLQWNIWISTPIRDVCFTGLQTNTYLNLQNIVVHKCPAKMI